MIKSTIPSLTEINIGREDSQIKNISDEKINRVIKWLQKNGYDALILSNRDNFAWLTTGGDAVLIEPASNCVACLAITLEKKFLVGHSMDVFRLYEEQIPGQGYEIIEGKWYQGSPQSLAANAIKGRIASDIPIAGVDCNVVDIHYLHYPLFDIELDRLRWLGSTVDRVYVRMTGFIKAGMTEEDLAIIFRNELARENINSDVTIVGSDERVFKYRHPTPTDKAIDRSIMLHTGACRWGLHAPITRNYHFGPLPERMSKAFQAVAHIQAKTYSMTKPGIPFKNILSAEKEMYARMGFPNEWQEHYQGGPTGYRIVNPVLGLTDQVVRVNTAFEWFSTVPGMKIAELTLLTEQGLEMPSHSAENWPIETITLGDQQTYNIPGVFIL